MDDRPAEMVSRDIDALFRLGVVTGLTDGRLLERFVARSDAEGQIAFKAIVRRHGPMVLGVCRRVLRHEQSAEDAFQATFLVLALKARTVRAPESLGPWLHGVAARIARRALVTSRRHEYEPMPAEDPLDTSLTPNSDLADLAGVLDEELGRLPEKYRLPIVLCYLEGRTQEDVAQALGWTKGTVSGRVARGKDLLRERLTRRGLAPSAGLTAATLLSRPASAAVPTPLLSSTVRFAAAAALSGAEAGPIAGSVNALAQSALKWMLLGRLVRAAVLSLALLLTAAALATPILLTGERPRPGGPALRAYQEAIQPRFDQIPFHPLRSSTTSATRCPIAPGCDWEPSSGDMPSGSSASISLVLAGGPSPCSPTVWRVSGITQPDARLAPSI